MATKKAKKAKKVESPKLESAARCERCQNLAEPLYGCEACGKMICDECAVPWTNAYDDDVLTCDECQD